MKKLLTAVIIWMFLGGGAVAQSQSTIQFEINNNLQAAWVNGLTSVALQQILTNLNTAIFTPHTPLPNFIGGVNLSNDSGTPNSILDITAGSATDSTNAVLITIGAFTKSTAGAWVSGTGQNGMGNGLTITASTWYHVCLANNSGTPDIWFDTSPTCANEPTGITDPLYRRIGSFRTDASAHILTFSQFGNEFLWGVPFVDESLASVPTTPALITLTIPTGIKIIARVRLTATASANFGLLLQSPDETSAQAGVPNANFDLATVASVNLTTDVDRRTNTSAQLRWSATASGITAEVVTYGWIDLRGDI